MSHGSLFTGIGLLDYGLTLAGLPDPAWVCESDDWRREHILARRFPGAVRHPDVRGVGADTAEPVDLIVGGFPCKGASTAGLRNGFDHPETVLWREMRRAVCELRPRHVLVENVANLLALHDGAVWGEVLGDLATLGYDTTWDCIPAGAVGAPHLRDRVFAVASHAESGPARRDAKDTTGGLEAQSHGGGGPAVADADVGGRPGCPQQDVRAQARQHASRRDDFAGRGLRVEWGKYEPAIRRWKRTLGRAAPVPLVRRVDDRDAARVERSRLSALGDGVQVQVGRLVGAFLLEIDPALGRATESEGR